MGTMAEAREVSGEARFVRAEGIVSRLVAGETILVPVNARSSDASTKAADLYVLNESGAMLWSALSAPRDMPDMARILMSEFGIDHATAAHDVEAFLHDMLQIGAIVRAGGTE